MAARSFGKGLLFAVIAALAAVTWQVFAGGLIGARLALLTGMAGLAVAWLYFIARSPAAGFKVVLVAAPFAGVVILLAPTVSSAALGLLLLIGVARGLFIDRVPVARGVARELFVGIGSLALASCFVPGGLTGLALATWSVFLVQSLTLLTPAPAPAEAGVADPFEAARDRAERILAL